MGTVITDGGVYDVYRILRNPPPSINGGPWYQYQYLSVRQSRRTSGRITLANHFDAWARAGMTVGTHVYTILATEAYQSPGGSSKVTIYSAPAPRAGFRGARSGSGRARGRRRTTPAPGIEVRAGHALIARRSTSAETAVARPGVRGGQLGRPVDQEMSGQEAVQEKVIPEGLPVPWKPKVAPAPPALALKLTLVAVTLPVLPANVAFQPLVIAAPLGTPIVTRQPEVEPPALTVTFCTKPPVQALVSAVAVQLPLPPPP